MKTAGVTGPLECLVGRLRDGVAPLDDPDLLDEAADEIERLQDERARFRGLIAELLDTELAELCCAGSDAPAEDVLGRMSEALLATPPCVECGAMTQAEAETKCKCAGDKDDCHGCQLWPD